MGSALLDLVEDNPVSRIPLSCYRSVKNVRDDVLNNLEKYQAGQANVVGANNFAAQNQKVAKNYANTSAPKIKLSSAGQKKIAETTVVTTKNSGKSTFGTTKRLVDEGSERTKASSDKKTTSTSASLTRVKKPPLKQHQSMPSQPAPQVAATLVAPTSNLQF